MLLCILKLNINVKVCYTDNARCCNHVYVCVVECWVKVPIVVLVGS